MKSEVSILAPVGIRKSESVIINSARSAGAAKFKHEKKRKKIAKVSRKKNRG